MSRITRLINSYKNFIAIPWKSDVAAFQRVLFCIYNQDDELRLRARIDEFEIATREGGHDWVVFDLANTFAQWFSTIRYAKSYFQQPHLLPTIIPKYLEFIIKEFKEFLQQNEIGENTVVAIKGVGSLFGFLRVKTVVENTAPMVPGRLLVFFPGSYENNNYRLLNAYDGWNYHAIPITGDEEF
ncbi:MAG: DUF1788 domain-containing protein [Candidatus Aminicenantes bacterium]